MSKEGDVKGKRQSKGMSKESARAKGCQRKGIRALFSHLPLSPHLLREISLQSLVVTSSTSDFEGCPARKLHVHIFHLIFDGSLAPKLHFHIFHFQVLRDISHESFVFTSSTSDFEGRLAQKLRFHIFHFQILRDASHKNYQKLRFHIFHCQILRDKASLSHLPLSDFYGCLAQRLRCHILLFQGNIAQNAFVRDSGCTKCSVLQAKAGQNVSRKMDWEGLSRDGFETIRLYRDHVWVGPAV